MMSGGGTSKAQQLRSLRHISILKALALTLLVVACASSRVPRMPRWTDSDMRDIPQPRAVEEYQKWDFADHSVFYPVGTLLDLEWTALRVAGRIGIGQGKQADNLNALDEAPNSSWFTNRHFHHRMDPEALAEGPGSAQPDTSGVWTVVSGKTLGLTPGFTMVDPLGQRYVIKFEAREWPEMSSSAEAISTRIFHAAGYNVPRNSVVFFDPGVQLQLAPDAVLRFPDGSERTMTEANLSQILEKVDPMPDGRLRCLASAYLEGTPLGPPGFHGRRRDDPNDRVMHEHRRELRGMRVISSWLNDTDRRTANMLDLYVAGEGGNRYVKHYAIDFGSSLGSNNQAPHTPRYGNEYIWDPGNVARSLFSLGFRTTRWEKPLPMAHRSIGYYENDTFRPGAWVTSYPNAAFLWRTDRDGYWGAKIVMSFRDEDIAAIVETGRLSDPDAAEELTRLMIERRDKIGRYWFDRVNPLDRFQVMDRKLQFEDLAVEGHLESASDTRYEATLVDGGRLTAPQVLDSPAMELGDLERGYYTCRLRTQRRHDGHWSDPTRVAIYLDSEGNGEVLRIERED